MHVKFLDFHFIKLNFHSLIDRQTSLKPKTCKMSDCWTRFHSLFIFPCGFLVSVQRSRGHLRGYLSFKRWWHPIHCEVLDFILLITENWCHMEHPFFTLDPHFLRGEHLPKTGEQKSKTVSQNGWIHHKKLLNLKKHIQLLKIMNISYILQ